MIDCGVKVQWAATSADPRDLLPDEADLYVLELSVPTERAETLGLRLATVLNIAPTGSLCDLKRLPPRKARYFQEGLQVVANRDDPLTVLCPIQYP